MQKYELLLTLPGTLDENEANKKLEEVVNVVKEFGSEVEQNPMGKVRLAYPVKQIRYGYFYTVVFEAEKNRVKALQEKLRLDRDILRFMVTYFNTNITTAQKIMYNTSDSGVTTMQEKAAPSLPARDESAKKVSLEEIDKKLDALLENDIIT